MGLAYSALGVMLAHAPADLPRLNEIVIDGRVMWVAFASFDIVGDVVRTCAGLEKLARRSATRFEKRRPGFLAKPRGRAASIGTD